MAGDFDGMIVTVTGASTGLGRAIAIGVAQKGAQAVVVNYARSADEAEITARAVREAGAEAIVVQGDVALDADCRRIAAATERFGRLDVLFNNAGITRFATDHSNLDGLSAEDFQAIYAVNVIGPYQMTRAARAQLEAAPFPGAVVNVSSIAGVTGVGSSVAYAASKGALNTMTLSLSRALAPKIRVNAVCPGYIDTTWHEKHPSGNLRDRWRDAAANATPLKAASSAEDIAASTLFFGSQASRHITGEMLIVDAGMHLGYAPSKAR